MEMQLHHKDNHEYDAFSLGPPIYLPRYNLLDIFLDSHKLQQLQAVAAQPPIAEANDPTLAARRLMYCFFDSRNFRLFSGTGSMRGPGI